MELLPKQPDTQHSSPTLPTLDQVHAQFEQWRNTRECRVPIPAFLWDQVFLLIGRYRENDICRKLRISKLRLKSAILSKSLPYPSQDANTSMDFIPFALPQGFSPSPNTKDSIAAEILHANGTALRVHSLNEQQFSNLLLIFMKGS